MLSQGCFSVDWRDGALKCAMAGAIAVALAIAVGKGSGAIHDVGVRNDDFLYRVANL